MRHIRPARGEGERVRLGGGTDGRRWALWAFVAALLVVGLAGMLRDRSPLSVPTDLVVKPQPTVPPAHTLRVSLGFGADPALRVGDSCGRLTGMAGREVAVVGADGATLGHGWFDGGEAQQLGQVTRCVLSATVGLPDAATYQLWFDYGAGLQVGAMPPLTREQLDCLGWTISPRTHIAAAGTPTAAERCLGVDVRHE